ncbi:MAG: transcriptional regulator with GAF, ATPase, and Fis domain [Sediminicola sp.]|jgi:transcriptional regulator with GAF, ATPase, and Fis domain
MKIAEPHQTKQAFWRQTMTYITGRKKVEEFLGFLVEGGKILSDDPSFYKTFPNLAEIAVPFLGDWFSIDLLFNSGRVQNIAEKHIADLDSEHIKKLRRSFRPFTQIDIEGNQKVIIAKKPIAYKTNSFLTSESAASILFDLEVQSALIIPLTLPNGCIGSIEILSLKESRGYDAADLALAEELARRISLAVERSLLYYANHTINKNIFPKKSTPYLKENIENKL